MIHLKQIGAVAIVAIVAAGVASGATYAATTGTAGAKACVTSSGILKLVNGNGSCPSGSSPAVLGTQGPAGPSRRHHTERCRAPGEQQRDRR